MLASLPAVRYGTVWYARARVVLGMVQYGMVTNIAINRVICLNTAPVPTELCLAKRCDAVENAFFQWALPPSTFFVPPGQETPTQVFSSDLIRFRLNKLLSLV